MELDLERLARSHGVLTSYTDIAGKVRRATPEALARTLEALGAVAVQSADEVALDQHTEFVDAIDELP